MPNKCLQMIATGSQDELLPEQSKKTEQPEKETESGPDLLSNSLKPSCSTIPYDPSIHLGLNNQLNKKYTL